ncbi:TonB-linked outer membrane protein, SusC/RagA family [Catalinimonas alkaloidigena]|uniref:TonB-linked outer membrane protein, SusC/RagA family n=1 Tax=Catalinimonas alkaloidigena TaxID=1075417 RepID=A0A1G9HMR3_9BACT|nr:TonB-dependent receptor [Catalinimonas alkaloidigena]SDL14271.1 TonB-linked outer membrane protein, SusC/RagA family [Catalinimonas alkaloidigena]
MQQLYSLLRVPRRRYGLLVALFGFTIFSVFGQNTPVTGTVTDTEGQPIPGVSITVKGTTKGTVTDLNGAFELSAADNEVLVFSFIGFLSKEIPVSGQATINVQLEEDVAQLDEVVVVGYGEQKRSDISGAVSQVEQKEIARSPAPNLSNNLVGRTAGIIATQRSGSPGDDQSNIFIRGIGTTGDASPLYVIDGIIRTARDFAQLNANEIESVSVLKDAASAAVFGVRGGNGVILVTTKRGVAGKMQIALNASYGIQERTRTPEYVGSYEWAMLYNEALVNQGQAPQYTDDDLQKYRDQSSPDTHPDTDWLSVLSTTAPMYNMGITANGGSDKVQYATSLSYLNQEGIVPSNVFKRYNFRSNIDANVTNTTKLSFDVSGRNESTNNVAAPELFRWLMSARPNLAPIKWSNGTYSSGPAYQALPENGYRNRLIQAFKGRVQLLQQLPVEGLSLKGIASFDKTLTDQKNWTFAKTPYYTLASDGSFVEAPRGATELYSDHNDYQSITLESHLNYMHTFGRSEVSGLVLYTQTKEYWNFISGLRTGYTLGIDELDFGSAANRNNRGYSGSSGRQGVVGRLNWTYASKYILEGSFRADGSEQFAPGNRWGFFPSASVAYVISRESFLENVPMINFLKLRGSYGVLGNDRLGGARFLYLQSFYQNGTAVFGDGNVQPAIFEGRLSSPNVTWETVKKLNIGFDATLWNNQLSVTADFFYDKRSDILGQRNLSVPSLLGIDLPFENLAKVDNKGIELVLGHQNSLSEDLRYSMNANLTFARNKVIYIDEPASENPNIRRTGRPLNAQFGYRALGLFQTVEEVQNAPTQIGDIAPGDIRYEDVNGDGKIDDLDRVYIGSSNTPEIIFGYNGNLAYKNFELSLLFQGGTRVQQYYSGEAAWPFFLGTSGVLKQNLDRWTPENTDASEPRVLINADNNHAGSSFWLRDASYVRLKNVEIAYNVPVANLKFVQGIRVYVNANNALTWTAIENFDPENDSGRGWGYPQFRIWNAGLNINF